MARWLWFWWPTIGYGIGLLFFVCLTYREVAAHEDHVFAGWAAAIWLYMMVREVRRTRAEWVTEMTSREGK